MATALITGSYGGLGTELVNIHAATGGDVILVGRSQSKLDAQAAQVEKDYGVKAYTIAADLSTEAAAQKIFDACQKLGILPDYFINNAGFGGQG
ncbi:SDR family NAD(P)-dependent oxidoreductase, partial [uncultured Rothia sp.]|uniref:SDR family NAD(P)-dependent oxidoreductase n=1 Tax=uncultured Rothia sp. TaxID=316088 RepID=UPI0028044741